MAGAAGLSLVYRSRPLGLTLSSSRLAILKIAPSSAGSRPAAEPGVALLGSTLAERESTRV